MRKVILTVILFLTIPFQVSAYTANSLDTPCAGPVGNTSGQKMIPSYPTNSAPTTGLVISCEWHGYHGGGWMPPQAVGTNATGNHSNCPDNRYVSDIRYSGGGTQYEIYCKYRDDDAPQVTLSDLGGVIPANNSRRVDIDYGLNPSGGTPAPAVAISGTIERHNNPLGTTAISLSDPFATLSNGFNINVSMVDGSDRINGYRPYTLTINNICDEAGNCATGLDPTYTYDVYAAGIDTGRSSVTGLGQLSAGNVADGVNRNIQVTLEDIYGNEVVQVSRSPFTRNVNAVIDYDNELYRDSYNNIGTSAVEINGTVTTTGTNRTFSMSNDSDGIYDFGVRTYAPTSGYRESIGIFGITDIYANISDILGDTSLSSGVGFDFRPLYTTTFSGDIPSQGFLEGAIQTSNIQVGRTAGTSVSGTSRSLRAEFGEVNGTSNDPNARYSITLNSAGVADGQQTNWTNTTNISGANFPASTAGYTPLSTFMVQSGPVVNQTFSYLASIIKYNIGSREVIYPSAVIGKTDYFGGAGTNNSYQEGIKIIGNTSSQGTGEVVINQFSDDVRILGKLTKSTFRRDISKSVYQVIRSYTGAISGNVTELGDVVSRPGEWENSSGEKLFGNKALLYKNPPSGRIDISADIIEGQKTLIVDGGDVYIRGNITNSTASDMLGIIVLGGNIYIDTSVTDVHAVLYTDNSILSSINGTPVTTTTNTATNLANQLYIKGSLFSENTIGGSRSSPIECPYNIPTTCNLDEAQKYDLNYLRRYFRYDSDSDGTPDTASGLQSVGASAGDINFPIIIEYNPRIQQTPPPFFS